MTTPTQQQVAEALVSAAARSNSWRPVCRRTRYWAELVADALERWIQPNELGPLGLAGTTGIDNPLGLGVADERALENVFAVRQRILRDERCPPRERRRGTGAWRTPNRGSERASCRVGTWTPLGNAVG